MIKSLLLFIAIMSVAVLQACPFCNTRSAAQIRLALFGPDLPFNLLVTTLPFIVCAALVFSIYKWGVGSGTTPKSTL